MSDTDVSRLAAWVRAAARQRRLMVPWEKDKEFLSAGGTIYYAVDSNIVKLYTTPWEMAVRQGHRTGYAKIFPGDPESYSEVLGRALADYIFFHLSPDQSLLVIPPIEKEIRRVYAAVGRDADQQQDRAKGQLAHLEVMVNKLKQLDDVEDLLDSFKKDVPDLAEILGGQRSYGAELRRLRVLLTERPILPFAYALRDDRIADPVMRNTLADATRGDLDISDTKEAWGGRLAESKKSEPIDGSQISATKKERRFDNLVDDAEALARLEFINIRLGKGRRLVLITGDEAMEKAARTYQQHDRQENFADLYLRHPRVFLAEPGVLFPRVDSDTHQMRDGKELVDWLDALLGQFSRLGVNYFELLDDVGDKKQQDQLQNAARQLLDLQPDIISSFRARWSSYLQNVVTLHAPDAYGEADHQLRDLLADLGHIRDRCQSRLIAEQHQDWEAFFVAAFGAGYGLLIFRPSGGTMPPRNPPILSFDTFRNFYSLTRELLGARRDQALDRTRYAEMRQTVRNEDLSLYTYYLWYGVLFAYEQSWRVAAILAKRAIEIAEEMSRGVPRFPEGAPERRISGREAAYLRAVALRHAARKASDLIEVASLLSRAESCLKQERVLRPELKVGEIRFPSERCALNLSYHLFHRFLYHDLPDDVPNLAHLQNEIDALLGRIGNISTTPRDLPREEWINFVVQRNLLVNYFMVALLRFSKEGVEPKISTLRSRVAQLRINFERLGDELPRTFLVEAIFRAASWWSARPEERSMRQRELREHFQGTAIQDNSVLPYDRQRFQFLRDLPSRLKV